MCTTDLYIACISGTSKEHDSQSFSDFLQSPNIGDLDLHVPDDVVIESITWHKNQFIKSMLSHTLGSDEFTPEALMAGMDLESGYFHFRLTGIQDYKYEEVMWIEELIKYCHQSFEVIASYFCYLIEERGELHWRWFCQHYSFASNRDEFDDEDLDFFDQYVPLANDLFYGDGTPALKYNLAAKLLLSQEIFFDD